MTCVERIEEMEGKYVCVTSTRESQEKLSKKLGRKTLEGTSQESGNWRQGRKANTATFVIHRAEQCLTL